MNERARSTHDANRIRIDRERADMADRWGVLIDVTALEERQHQIDLRRSSNDLLLRLQAVHG